MSRMRNGWQGGGLLVLAAAAVMLLFWWLNEPVAALVRSAADVRIWLGELGPMAPIAYVLFYAAQILIAPLPGNFLAVIAGYMFGIKQGLMLSALGLSLGAGLALLIARKFGRPLLERFFDHAELIRWERKLRLRSPLVWYVFFIFPVPDLVIYVAGLGTLKLRWLLPAILAGRMTGIMIGLALGKMTAILPAEWVFMQWVLLLALGYLAIRFQRPIRYHLLVNLRRMRRMFRTTARSFVKAPVGTPVE
ncbi:MAG: VTT domain-containing protein [Anaerolineales bacterium]|nr:VTT domain-containing protein [Anaerolineales bacterium]